MAAICALIAAYNEERHVAQVVTGALRHVSAVVLVGIALGAAIGTWGVVVPSAFAFLGAAVVTGQFRRRPGRASSE